MQFPGVFFRSVKEAAVQDYIFLVADQTADEGGESYMLDGHAMVKALPADLQREFFETPLETRNFAERVGKATTWRSPVLQRVEGCGRWRLRAPIDGAADGGPLMDQPCAGEAAASGQRVIDAWQEGLLRAGPAATRFSLKRGQALVCDNCGCTKATQPDHLPRLADKGFGCCADRIMHAREPHEGPRLLWRCWVWTTQRLEAALPHNCLCMCQAQGRHAGGRHSYAPCPHCPQVDSFEKVQRLGRNVSEAPWPVAQ